MLRGQQNLALNRSLLDHEHTLSADQQCNITDKNYIFYLVYTQTINVDFTYVSASSIMCIRMCSLVKTAKNSWFGENLQYNGMLQSLQ